MNFYDESIYKQLSGAVERSYRVGGPVRNVARQLIREYAGPAYASHGGGYGGNYDGASVGSGSGASSGGSGGALWDDGSEETYLNVLNQLVDAYQIILAANRPEVIVTTEYEELIGFSFHFGKAVNNLLKEIRIEETLRNWVIDAFFAVGIIKVHMAESALVEIEHEVWMDVGTPFASNISIDNFVYDASAAKVGLCKFFGDMYRIPFVDFQEGIKQGLYNRKTSKDLQPTTKIGSEGDRIENISVGWEVDPDELEPMIDLADIYIKRTGKIYTFPIVNHREFVIQGPPVSEMVWTGNELGPYHLLGFNDVPQNVMPASPAEQVAGLARLINNLMRKQAMQATRQKDVHIYTAAGADDAKNVQRAGDGEWVQVGDVRELGVMKQGGVDGGNQNFLNAAMQMFDRMAGNLQAMLGLGAQTETVGQEQLIHSATSKKETSMMARVLGGTTGVIKDLGILLWEDEFKTIVGTSRVPGTSIVYDSTWKPGERAGRFVDYNFEIDIYSMVYRTPAQRLSAITQMLTQIMPQVLPLAEMGVLDFEAFVKLYAEMLHEPRLIEMLNVSQTPRFGDSPTTSIEKKPSQTSREYIRRNVGGGGNDTANPFANDMQSFTGSQNGNGNGNGLTTFGGAA